MTMSRTPTGPSSIVSLPVCARGFADPEPSPLPVDSGAVEPIGVGTVLGSGETVGVGLVSGVSGPALNTYQSPAAVRPAPVAEST